jgi:AT hook motif
MTISAEVRMAFDPKTYQDGFTAGWLAAFRAISEATTYVRSTPIPPAMVREAFAGAAPARPRGRPPKSAAIAQPVKRKRGRPRKTEKA